MQADEPGLRVFKDQTEANAYLADHLREKRPCEARLIQYSGQAVHDLLMTLLSVKCKVQLLVEDPRTAITKWQYDRIWSHISDLLGPALSEEEKSLVEVRKYTSPGSLRAIKIDSTLLVLSWYTYFPVTNTNEDSGLKGHDNALVCINKSSTGWDILERMFDRAFRWLWEGGARWHPPVRKQDGPLWSGEYTTSPPPDFSKLKLSPNVADFLRSRWLEAERCVQSNAHLSAIMMMGSLLEGLLFDAINQHFSVASRSSFAPREPHSPRVKHIKDWMLNDMINVAHDVGWIGKDVKGCAHTLRDYRNYIHPSRQIPSNVVADTDTVNICWHVVRAAINDLAMLLGTAP